MEYFINSVLSSSMLCLCSQVGQLRENSITVNNSELKLFLEVILCPVMWSLALFLAKLLGLSKNIATPVSDPLKMNYYWRIRHSPVTFLKLLSNIAFLSSFSVINLLHVFSVWLYFYIFILCILAGFATFTSTREEEQRNPCIFQTI